MGGNIVRRLQKNGHHCIAYDRNQGAVEKLADDGATGASSLEELVGKFTETPRVVWVMLPAGKITGETVDTLGKLLGSGDIIIDGGNSFYKDDIRRAKELQTKGIHYIDVGTSGGVWGLERGYCMMVGGDKMPSTPSILFSMSWRRALAIFREPRAARRSQTRVPSAATSTPALSARATSSRWFTTASNTD